MGRPGNIVYTAIGALQLTTPVSQQNQTFSLSPTSTVTNQATFPMRSAFREYLPNGSSGYYQGYSPGSIGIALSTNTGFPSNPEYFVSKNTANGKVEAVVNGGSYYTLDFDFTSFVYLRITVFPTQILFQFSNDNVTFGHDQLITRVESGDLYVKTYYGSNGDTISDLKVFGFSLNNAL